MRVLVACVESQRVTKEFRALGFEAFSCDIIDTSGDKPEWHIKDDVLNVINDDWGCMVAFPPCTYLTNTGNRWFNISRYGYKAIERHELRVEALEFFMKLVYAPIPRIAIENPIGYMSTSYRKPDQIIQPYEFGDPRKKINMFMVKKFANIAANKHY